MATLLETRTANDNVSSYDDLMRRIGTLESQVVAWMNQATILYGDVEVGDQQSILDLRASLISKLNAATAI